MALNKIFAIISSFFLLLFLKIELILNDILVEKFVGAGSLGSKLEQYPGPTGQEDLFVFAKESSNANLN